MLKGIPQLKCVLTLSTQPRQGRPRREKVVSILKMGVDCRVGGVAFQRRLPRLHDAPMMLLVSAIRLLRFPALEANAALGPAAGLALEPVPGDAPRA